MNWTVVVDIFFQLGGWVVSGLVFYGGWLVLRGPNETTDEGGAPKLQENPKREPGPVLFIAALLVCLVSMSPGTASAGESMAGWPAGSISDTRPEGGTP